jgi:serine protease Do
MSEFDNNNPNPNPNDSRDNNAIYNQNQYNKVPQYSFWAEQAPKNTYSNYNPRTNAWEYSNNPANSGFNAGNQYSNAEYTPNSTKQKERKTGNKALKFITKAICFGIIAGISFLGFQQIYYSINPDAADLMKRSSAEKAYEIGYTELGTVKTKDRSAIREVIKATIPAVVSINSTTTQTTQWFGQQYDQPQEGSGSGIIVGKNEDELLIATNNHVVAGTDKIKVTFKDGTEAEAEIKGTDATADLAVVTVDIATLTDETLNAIAVAKLGSSDEVQVGEMAIAIGNALGYGQSVTVGFVSAKDREVEVSDGYNSKTMILLQTDAAINPGNSGGALLNANGEVIGINTVKYASNEVEGMGYAIPITRATPIITELMNREILEEEEQGYLGITGNDVTEEIASFYNIPVGVFINDLAEGGAAEKAGLLPGDVIIKVNDIEVTSITQLRDYVTSLRVGTEVEVTYMRNTDGKYEEALTTVTLGINPTLSTRE